jgi:hypothetical protein
MSQSRPNGRPYTGKLPPGVPPLAPYAPLPAPSPVPQHSISPVLSCGVSYRFGMLAMPTLRVAGGAFSARAVPEGCCSFEEIVRAVLGAWPDIKRNELFSPRRSQYCTRPRLALYALLKEFTRWSLPRIGNAVGGRDHTTVMSGLKRVSELGAEDADFAASFATARAVCLAHVESRAAAERARLQCETDAEGGAP